MSQLSTHEADYQCDHGLRGSWERNFKGNWVRGIQTWISRRV